MIDLFKIFEQHKDLDFRFLNVEADSLQIEIRNKHGLSIQTSCYVMTYEKLHRMNLFQLTYLIEEMIEKVKA